MGRAAARKKRLLGHKERVITCVVLGQLPTSTVLHEQNFTILLARITHLTSYAKPGSNVHEICHILVSDQGGMCDTSMPVAQLLDRTPDLVLGVLLHEWYFTLKPKTPRFHLLGIDQVRRACRLACGRTLDRVLPHLFRRSF